MTDPFARPGSLSEREAASRDLWPRNALDWLAGHPLPLAGGIVRPATLDELVAVVREAARQGRRLVPLGAGSGVCGGIRPGEEDWLLDLKGLRRVRVDREASTVHAEAGALGRHLEEAAARHGLTVGHAPSSIMCSTVGGWLAARGAGQLSSRYGKIEDICVGATVVRADGTVERLVRGDPGLDALIGSEGALGVIAEAALRAWPLREGWTFQAFAAGDLGGALHVARAAVRSRPVPSVIRAYDPFDTRIALSEGGGGSAARLSRMLLRAPRLVRWAGDLAYRRCLVVVGWEGEGPVHEAARAALVDEALRHDVEDLGEEPGRRWLRKRYDVSFKLMDLLKLGLFGDTFEVACPWTLVEHVYRHVLDATAPEALAMAHFSHAWSEGCAIYFTLVGWPASYEATWERATRAAHEAGATISHHHGIGRLRAGALPGELGGAHRVLVDLKARHDPDGRLNPGVMGLPGPVVPAEPLRHPVGLQREDGLWTGSALRGLGEVERIVRDAGWTLGVPVEASCTVLEWLLDDHAGLLSTRLGSARDRLVALSGHLEDGTPYATRIAPRTAAGPGLLPTLLDGPHEVETVTLRLAPRPARWLLLAMEGPRALEEARELIGGVAEVWGARRLGGRVELALPCDGVADWAALALLTAPGARSLAEPDRTTRPARWVPWRDVPPDADLVGFERAGAWLARAPGSAPREAP